MIIADTSGLLALFNTREPRHDDVQEVLRSDGSPLVISPFVIAELDSLVGTRIGLAAELAVLRELAGPGYVLADLDADSLLRATEVVDSYGDQRIGVTDASLVVLAERFGTDRVLTLDRRHFDVLRTRSGRPFDVLP